MLTGALLMKGLPGVQIQLSEQSCGEAAVKGLAGDLMTG